MKTRCLGGVMGLMAALVCAGAAHAALDCNDPNLATRWSTIDPAQAQREINEMAVRCADSNGAAQGRQADEAERQKRAREAEEARRQAAEARAQASASRSLDETFHAAIDKLEDDPPPAPSSAVLNAAITTGTGASSAAGVTGLSGASGSAGPGGTPGTAKDPSVDYTGQPCSFFTRPALEADGARMNYYADGAHVSYGASTYVCQARHWKRLRETNSGYKDDDIRAEVLERRRLDNP